MRNAEVGMRKLYPLFRLPPSAFILPPFSFYPSAFILSLNIPFSSGLSFRLNLNGGTEVSDLVGQCRNPFFIRVKFQTTLWREHPGGLMHSVAIPFSSGLSFRRSIRRLGENPQIRTSQSLFHQG